MSRYLVVAALLVAACGHPPITPDEKLYFSLEIRQEGRLIGKPKLLGLTNAVARLERRQPGATLADYQLKLFPVPRGERFQIALDLSLPQAQGHWDVTLLNGETRTLDLPKSPRRVEVSLLVMRVNSPEFHRLMDLSGREDPAPYVI